ncbi:MAG: thiolase family protein [Acidimicrobiia bacterium]
MGLTGAAVIAGYAERKAERRFTGTPRFGVEQWAALAADALVDAGIEWSAVDGICTSDVAEAPMFVPATVAEYCGWKLNFAERVDLGGANSVGMVWRAAVAVEMGICDVVVCAATGQPRPSRDPGSGAAHPRNLLGVYGASSPLWGSPQAEFDIPFGSLGQNSGYALYARRYHDTYGWDERARAKIAADQRVSANANPNAVFYETPASIDDVLESRMISEPLRILEIVMPVSGGGAVIVARKGRSRKNRGAVVKGFGEHLTHKTPTHAPDLTATPVGPAAASAFAMAGVKPADVDMAQIYDCYTITALLTIEDSGFCEKGRGMAFVNDHDLSYKGDFPVNTHGGQLGFGQAGAAGGMSQVIEAVRQIQGRAGARQVRNHDLVYVSGTGGVMSEQSALVLEGEGG